MIRASPKEVHPNPTDPPCLLPNRNKDPNGPRRGPPKRPEMTLQGRRFGFDQLATCTPASTLRCTSRTNAAFCSAARASACRTNCNCEAVSHMFSVCRFGITHAMRAFQYTHIYVYSYPYTNLSVCVYIHTYLNTHAKACAKAYAYAFTYTYTYSCTCIHIHVHVHIHIHVHVLVLVDMHMHRHRQRRRH